MGSAPIPNLTSSTSIPGSHCGTVGIRVLFRQIASSCGFEALSVSLPGREFQGYQSYAEIKPTHVDAAARRPEYALSGSLNAMILMSVGCR